MGGLGRTGSSGGFSLVELLVAMALLAVILVLVFDGLHTGTRVWERIDRRVDAAEQMRTTQRFIRQRLEEAVSANRTPLEAGGRAFSGEAQAMTFVAPLPGRSGAGGLYRFRLYAAPFEDATRLLVEYRPYDPRGDAEPDQVDPQRVSLQDDVAGLEFSYFGDDGVTGQPGWQGQWQDRDELPGLVRVRIWPQASPAEAWPELVVAPRGGAYREPPRLEAAEGEIRVRRGGRDGAT